MWNYNLNFFFCKFIIDFFLVSEVLYERSCSTKGAAQSSSIISPSSEWEHAELYDEDNDLSSKEDQLSSYLLGKRAS